MERQALYFTGPRQVALQSETLPSPAFGQVLVKTIMSAISPGTELLVYRGLAPADLARDETITALAGDFSFPLTYGYAAVGQVLELGTACRWKAAGLRHMIKPDLYLQQLPRFTAAPGLGQGEVVMPVEKVIPILDQVRECLRSAAAHRRRTGRPLVTLSYAQSLDGSIADRPGRPLALSGPQAMALTHGLRAAHEAILVGIGTVLADNPRLNVRLVTGPDPQPVVVDSRLRFPPYANLLSNGRSPGLPPTPGPTPSAGKPWRPRGPGSSCCRGITAGSIWPISSNTWAPWASTP